MTVTEQPPQNTGISKTLCSLVEKWTKSEKLNELAVSGRSMKPFLNKGMKVVVKHNRDLVKTGDIIVYLRNNRLILHRVLRIIKQGDNICFLTKGDSAMSFDNPLVDRSEVVGIVISISNNKKTIDLKKWQWRSISKIITIGSFLVGTLMSYVTFIFNIFFQYRADSIKIKDKEL